MAGPTSHTGRPPMRSASTGTAKKSLGARPSKPRLKPKQPPPQPKNHVVDRITATKNKPKINKPKHLKRKLEQLNADDIARQKVVKELQEWKRKKQGLQQQKWSKKPTSDPRRPDQASMHAAVLNFANDDAVEGRGFARGRIQMKSSKSSKTPSRPQEGQAKEAIALPKRRRRGRKGKEAAEKQQEDRQVETSEPSEKATTTEAASTTHETETDTKTIGADDQPVSSAAAAHQDSSNNDSDSSDSSDDEEVLLQTSRQRGKGRQGRQDTSAKVQEKQLKPVSTMTAPTSNSETKTNKDQGQTPKNNKLSDKRYCKGRKPVTDYVVGQKYDGKVVYVKPFGIFIDIGCHSDAFCHVSRLQDDFCPSPETLYQPGDVIEGARVVEVDRAKKRLTVSLQSEGKLADELRSIEARNARLEKRKESEKKAPKEKKAPEYYLRGDFSLAAQVSAARPCDHATKHELEPPESPFNKPESEMTPQELKRVRKLARRAVRRGERDGEETSLR